MIREVVLATRNRDKGKEIAALLGDLGIRIRTLAEYPDMPEVVEDGATCEANAVKKAEATCRHSGLPAVADDTGLMVDALGGRPGVFSARYAGERASYADNWRKLLQELAGVPRERRTARFITVAALARPSGEKVDVVEGILDGLIAEGPRGSDGFGYDPVFLLPDLGRTLAELASEEKNRISHRARAFVKLREHLKVMTAER